MMRGWLVVSLVLGFAGTVYAEAEVNRQDPFKTVTVAAAGFGVGAAVAQSHVWPVAAGLAFATVGPMLEWQSDCAKHGLENYEGQETDFGNRGNMNVYGPISEERVKWEKAPNGWMQRKCQ